MDPLISSLVENGKTLATLLTEAKRKSNRSGMLGDIKSTVGTVDRLLGAISSDQDPRSAANVLKKIEQTLQDFMEFDNGNARTYQEFKNQIETTRREMLFSMNTKEAQHLRTQSCPKQHPYNLDSLVQESDFEEAYGSLTQKELQCLFCSFMFTSSMEEIKKRELFFWWIGMNLVQDPLEGDQVLRKLVAEGFIARVFGNRRIYNRYKMQDCALDKIERKLCESRLVWPYQNKLEEDSISIIHDARTLVEPNKVTALLNIKRRDLNSRTMERISRMKNIKVLSLGITNSRSSGSGDYVIELERVSNLKSTLRRLKEVRCLSLQGISRIVQLPSTIYKLKNLKVLDLKACHDLMTIPKGIESLQCLTHLDLSECYMLDHVPKGVASLRNLVALKGFVINVEHNSSSCTFDELCGLGELRKLSIRIRRMEFPSQHDLETLHKIVELKSLRIAWVGKPGTGGERKEYSADVFPEKLEKLELQAAPATTASQLLMLITKQDTLEKLYIKGGHLWDFGATPKRALKFVHVKFLRLRYLPNLRIHWSHIQSMFPNLVRLEVHQCPKLIFFPIDQNGVWELLSGDLPKS